MRHVQTPPQTPHVQTSRKAPGLFNPITKPRPPAPPAPQMPAKAKAKAKAVPKILQKHGPKDQAKQDRETAARNRTAIAQRYGHAPKPAAAKTEKEPRVPKRAKKGTMRPRPVAVPAAVAVASRASVLPALAEARAEGRPEGTYLGYPVLAELPELAEQYTQAKTRREEAQAERDTVAGQIEALMLAADTGKVTCGAFVVIRVESEGRKSLSREKLLELGVPADTIAAATIQGEGFSYVKVERADEAGEKRHARKENSGGNGRRSGRTA